MSSIPSDSTGLIVACPSCGTKNRLHFDRLGHEHRCAHCKASIPAPASTVEVTSAAIFDALVASTALPVVVDYWAPWCGPCRAVAPELERVAQRNAGRFLVVKVNTDQVPELGDRYGIRSIPTMAVFARGREIVRSAGARPAAAIEQMVNDALQAA
jgi:thioredoxin 2